MLFFFLFRPLFRSSPVLFVRLLSFVCNLSLSLDSCCLSFEVILSFLSARFSFETSLSFKSCLVRSTPLIRLKSSLSLVGLLLTFVRSLLSFLFAFFSFETSLSFKWLSFEVFFRFSLLFFRLRALLRSSPVLFVRLLSFVRNLSLSLDSG